MTTQITVRSLAPGENFKNEFGSWTLLRKNVGGVIIRTMAKKRKVVHVEDENGGHDVTFNSNGDPIWVSYETPVDEIVQEVGK